MTSTESNWMFRNCRRVVGRRCSVTAEFRFVKNRGLKIAIFRGKRREKRPEIFEISGLGGDKRDRTADLLNAIQALSQLSYTPILRPLLQTASVL